MKENPVAEPRNTQRDFLALLQVLCAITVVVVMMIDLKIKNDIIRSANQAHADLEKLKILMGISNASIQQDETGLPERTDLPASSNGHIPDLVSSAYVDTDTPGIQTEDDSPHGRQSFVAPAAATSPRNRNGNKTVRTGNKQVGS
jgi:hypothetical protein